MRSMYREKKFQHWESFKFLFSKQAHNDTWHCWFCHPMAAFTLYTGHELWWPFKSPLASGREHFRSLQFTFYYFSMRCYVSKVNIFDENTKVLNSELLFGPKRQYYPREAFILKQNRVNVTHLLNSKCSHFSRKVRDHGNKDYYSQTAPKWGDPPICLLEHDFSSRHECRLRFSGPKTGMLKL
jgi:hypothetical protein